MFIPKWTSVQDTKFPAYTKYTLEVCELIEGVLIQKFTVQITKNTTATSSISKKEIEESTKKTMVLRIMEDMLKYYMYGNAT